MPISERAKQFMPFAALRGFYEVIRQEEKVKTNRPELGEEDLQKLDAIIVKLKKGQFVKVTFYENGFICTLNGVVTLCDKVFKILRIIKKDIIFDNLLNIEVLKQ